MERKGATGGGAVLTFKGFGEVHGAVSSSISGGGDYHLVWMQAQHTIQIQDGYGRDKEACLGVGLVSFDACSGFNQTSQSKNRMRQTIASRASRLVLIDRWLKTPVPK